MGVPAFYRWLSGKYPKAVVSAVDPGDDCDYSKPNPNGEYDHFYLDMNGIIHPCFHPDEELFPPTTFNEVFTAIFDYIDHLFRIVRPTKLLFMAIDGVAPRAKMNQQRARRYKSAKDAHVAKVEEERLRFEFEQQGKEILPMEHLEVSDSNVITPGTVFMHKLSKALEYYIRLRLNTDPSWRNVEVILSDANVPGEGEHKIMSYIRYRRSSSCVPNTRHCVYGLDADLIMLALATKEIHFSILREEVIKEQQQEQLSTFLASISEKEKPVFSSRQWFKTLLIDSRVIRKKTYQFINIWTLREYLELDMKPQPHCDVDVERIVDDFIFLCFFTGNDFLPHIPSIEIHEGGIDLLIAVYKSIFKSVGGYLVDTSKLKDKNHAYINIKSVEKFILEVGTFENKIFERRWAIRQKKIQRLLQEMSADEDNSCVNVLCDNFNEDCVLQMSSACGIVESKESVLNKCNASSFKTAQAGNLVRSDIIENTRELKQKLKQLLRDKEDLYKNGFADSDKVKLGQPGWKERYYKEKFSTNNSKEIEDTRRQVVQKYVEGLCWILQYYFVGVPSWSWFYPFYYGPFASDLKGLSCANLSFSIGHPFKPFDQLMVVLPPGSAHAVPEAYRCLMENEVSPIVQFYPTDFEVDHDGKRYAWQGVCKLPFVDEGLLTSATKMLHMELKEEETERNSVKKSRRFVFDSVNLASCSEFTIPETQVYVPRLLEGVVLPEKAINQSDVIERTLWHEDRSIQTQIRRPVCETWKAAGSRGAGRGKQIADDSRALLRESRQIAISQGRGQYVSDPWRPRSVPMADMRKETIPSRGGYSRGSLPGRQFAASQGRGRYVSCTWRPRSVPMADTRTETMPSRGGYSRGSLPGRQSSDSYGRQTWRQDECGRGKGERW